MEGLIGIVQNAGRPNDADLATGFHEGVVLETESAFVAASASLGSAVDADGKLVVGSDGSAPR